jgi:proteasome accessory factor B
VVEIVYGPGVYDAAKESRRTRIRPYLIEPSALTHALYLIGWDEARGARRTFKLERIVEATLTPETFEPEAAWDPVSAMRDGWDIIADQPVETITLRFTPTVARRVAETIWHPSQKLEWHDDGSLTWQGRVAGTHEIRIWILGWGADAEVLAPRSLRESVAAELLRAASAYEA